MHPHRYFLLGNTYPQHLQANINICYTHINNKKHPRHSHLQPFNHKASTRGNSQPHLHSSCVHTTTGSAPTLTTAAHPANGAPLVTTTLPVLCRETSKAVATRRPHTLPPPLPLNTPRPLTDDCTLHRTTHDNNAIYLLGTTAQHILSNLALQRHTHSTISSTPPQQTYYESAQRHLAMWMREGVAAPCSCFITSIHCIKQLYMATGNAQDVDVGAVGRLEERLLSIAMELIELRRTIASSENNTNKKLMEMEEK
ncbi:hypothetical protein Pmani_009097 [Petrolisthes manimaculis]|uniref:Uncharacterized protein n=1 Tax=Petrolisthes manimaculis TaxID=1843537 RepID=A0AAE1UIA1_9EUCA|nr:hypothetical protein Pmani_009097 [Petrolisthes manimaculis]